MIRHHIDKLVGLPYRQLVQKMPRGPAGRWANLMIDTKIELEHRAKTKAARQKGEGDIEKTAADSVRRQNRPQYRRWGSM